MIRSGLSPIGATLHGGDTPYNPIMSYDFRNDRKHSGLFVAAYTSPTSDRKTTASAACPAATRATTRSRTTPALGTRGTSDLDGRLLRSNVAVSPYSDRRRAIIRHPMSEAPNSGCAEPFWERAYQDDGADAFGRPSSELVSLAERLPEAASVLDAGCGEGRNARFLAARGYRVDAFDVSAVGIDKLTRMAARDGVRVNAWTDDLNTFRYSRCYDLIISHGVLHRLNGKSGRG